MSRTMLPSLQFVFLAGLLAAGSAGVARAAEGGAAAGSCRVGVFDSRAVAVAYAASKGFNEELALKMKEYRQAKDAGDQEKVKQLEAAGQAGQEQLHLQGFGTASVSGILDRIKDQLPAIARQNKVDLIVSKWDIAYQTPTVETVDITETIIEPFQPSERTRKIVADLKGKDPVPAEELKDLHCK